MELVVGSASDPGIVTELMARSDGCFHLASSVGVELIVDQPLESVLRTVRAADTVMEAAARFKTPLVFTSTSEVYGKSNGRRLREGDDRIVGAPSMSRWSYAIAKAFGEAVAHGYARDTDARMTVARLFNCIGPRQSSAYGMVVPRFVQQALKGEDLTVYGTGGQTRCFTHVHDTVAALVGLSDCEGAAGNAYNVGSSTAVPIIELARRTIERTGSRSEVRVIPYEQAYGDGFEELGNRVPDCTAIESLIGWRPSRTLDDAIDDIVAFETRTPSAPRVVA